MWISLTIKKAIKYEEDNDSGRPPVGGNDGKCRREDADQPRSTRLAVNTPMVYTDSDAIVMVGEKK